MAYIKVDTREQDNKYILSAFKANNYKYEELKLDEGDYQSSDNDTCVIDLKNGILEVQKNIAGKENDKARFLNEIIRCITKKKKLIVLIREDYIYSLYGVQFWKSPKRFIRSNNGKSVLKPFTNVSGKFIMKVMERYQNDYGVEWLFCKRENTANAIIEILNRNGGNIKRYE